jgi:hypothetical protein
MPYLPSARREIDRLRRDLEDLFLRSGEIDEADELSADLSRYLCVRVSGFLEQALAYCGRSLCERGSWGNAQKFSLSWLRQTPNPRADQIVKFVQRFDDAWAEDLVDLLGDNERGQTINALLGIRNEVAHGKSQGISHNRVLEYFEVVEEIVAFLLERFEPLPVTAA